MNHTKQDNMRKTVIGAPLLLTLVFCFSFLMFHPGTSGVARSSSESSESPKKSSETQASANKLSPLPAAHTDLQPLDHATPSGSPEVSYTASPQNTNIANPQSSALQRTGSNSAGMTGYVSGGSGSPSNNLNSSLLQTTLHNLLKLY